MINKYYHRGGRDLQRVETAFLLFYVYKQLPQLPLAENQTVEASFINGDICYHKEDGYVCKILRSLSAFAEQIILTILLMKT